MTKILVTGGAGFIGSHLVDRLINLGHHVTILDNLESQVHRGRQPKYINKEADFVKGDVRDYKVLHSVLSKKNIVFHLASRVGVAQSNYEIEKYVNTNVGGMANLLDIAVNQKLSLQKIIMTASMTSYGEGSYRCASHGLVKPHLRQAADVRKGQWDPHCPLCQKTIRSVETTEQALINNNSIYSLTKNVQEELLSFIGTAYHIPFVSLRCFNVYGPRQSLSNPYTGVSAIFISRLKHNRPPVVYEDGNQTRDFVSVHDVVDALIASMNNENAKSEILNIGSGKPTKIKDLAVAIAKVLGKKIKPQITGEFRLNDIRHCFADISKAKKVLGWQPKISLNDGLQELVSWSHQETAKDLFDLAEKQLRDKSLL